MIAPREEPTSISSDVASIAREIRFRLEVARDLGWEINPRIGGTTGDMGPAGVRALDGQKAATEPLPTTEPAVDLQAERSRRQALLDEIDHHVKGCKECPLCQGRTNTVFGVGDPSARLMFVGEGPGYDEDRQGEPFVGKAGKLLDRMIAAMGLRRDQVYIANIVKCRPPGNRNPEPTESLKCLPYLREQIDIIKPEIICTLGNTPTRQLLQSTQSITRIRGTMLKYGDIPALPTFHPAYLLRNSAHKRLAWEDLQKIMQFLGLKTKKE